MCFLLSPLISQHFSPADSSRPVDFFLSHPRPSTLRARLSFRLSFRLSLRSRLPPHIDTSPAQPPSSASSQEAVHYLAVTAAGPAQRLMSTLDVPAGPWLSQAWATATYGPTVVGGAVVAPLYGLFLGRLRSHVADEELWREHTKRYRAFLFAITALVTLYALLLIEETCYWGSK
jgi:hypothetical protein